MSEDIYRQKLNAFMSLMESQGLTTESKLNSEMILNLLNSVSQSQGKNFDSALAQKFIGNLQFGKEGTIKGEKFASSFMNFERELERSTNMFEEKLQRDRENLKNYSAKFDASKDEKLNENGLGPNAKVTVEINNVRIQKKLEGINSLDIKLIYNESVKETSFKLGNNYAQLNEKFEFKPLSKHDHFELIMKGENDLNQEFIIGSKVFPLDNIESMEEYKVTITVPDAEGTAAEINATILLVWSDKLYYGNKKRRAENRIKKLEEAVIKSKEYLKNVRDIYSE